MESIGKRIKEVRQQNKLSIEQIAKMLNISSSFVALIESGKRRMGLDTLIKFSKLFNISLDYLIFGDKRQDIVNKKDISTLMSDLREEEADMLYSFIQKLFYCRYNFERLKFVSYILNGVLAYIPENFKNQETLFISHLANYMAKTPYKMK